MDKLKDLVFSFYREEPQIIEKLHPLTSCTLSRHWDSIYIDCLNAYHFVQVGKILNFLSPPFALLGFAKQLILRLPDSKVQTFSLEDFSR